MFVKKLLINGLKGVVLSTSLVTGAAMGASWGAIGIQDTTGPQVYQAINGLKNLTGSSAYTSNQQLGSLYVDDVGWSNLNGLAVIGVSAGNTNTLGTYNLTSGVVTTLTNGYTGDQWIDPIEYYDVSNSGQYGWHLQSDTTEWFSEDSRNSGDDHMLVFDLGGSLTFDAIDKTNSNNPISVNFANPFLIAWEDISLPSADKDYNDVMYLVDATLVPIPPSVLLFLSGLVGLMGSSGFRRLRR